MCIRDRRYAPTEKEGLALTWACERFSDYLFGLDFHLQTIHKLLVPLISSKHLEELPLRVQRFHLHMMCYCFTISHIPGKEMMIADMLSRAPTGIPQDQINFFIKKLAHSRVNVMIQGLPATDEQLETIKQKHEQDEVCQQIKTYCQDGWPAKHEVLGACLLYTSPSPRDATLSRMPSSA